MPVEIDVIASDILTQQLQQRDIGNDLNHTEHFEGTLFKWTNYIHGWQERFITLDNNTLSYYYSENDKQLGCRGALNLQSAVIKSHGFDELRFDICLKESVWYLRASSLEIKKNWLERLNRVSVESIENNVVNHDLDDLENLTEKELANLEIVKDLKQKISEIETYRNLMCVQLESLQDFFDISVDSDIKTKSGKSCADYKGEVICFKATSSAVMNGISRIISDIVEREDSWQKKLERAHDRIQNLENTCQFLKCKSNSQDHSDGPCSTLGEDEFYDAVELELNRIEEEVAFRDRLKEVSQTAPNSSDHFLWPEIERVTKEQVHYASIGVGEGAWQLFAEDGDMKMYRREEEINGLVIDPLKACHIVKGVTGHEMCHYFFSPEYRYDWETTLESMHVVEKIADNVLLFMQIHKRIWPSAQRDALFWSHINHMSDKFDNDAPEIWTVVNHSTNIPQYNEKNSKCVRILLTVCLYCQTLINPPKSGQDVCRDDITCKITYCSVVNPGGWVPASALRAIYKREYPKFLKRFTKYVVNQTMNKPIMF